MRKNQDFLRKVRLCLCLLIGIWACSCTILRRDNNDLESSKNYLLTVFLPPGFPESELLSELGDTVWQPGYPALIPDVFDINKPVQFAIQVRLRDEAQLKLIQNRLMNAGLGTQYIYVRIIPL
jgi:hypothetical protein